MTNSEARKRLIEARARAECPLSQPIPAPVDSGTIGRLNEAERVALGAAGDHHPETCDCSPYVVDSGYAPENCCDGLLDTFAVVERIVREHTDRALAEVEERIEAWIRHGEAVPADVTTYDRGIVHEELRGIVRAARQEQGR